MSTFQLISQYFWALCLAFSLFNYLAALRRLSSSSPDGGANVESARHHIRLFALAASSPWLVMGLGQLSGATPTVWYYFRPQDLNPYVIAWLGVIFLLSLVYAAWVFFADGARKVRDFGLLAAIGARNLHTLSEPIIKLLAALGPFFVIAWVYLAASMNTPLPP